MKRLFIAEKPAIANDLKSAIGGNFEKKDGFFEGQNDIITWCYGHIIESVPPEGYNPSYSNWTIEDLPLKMFPLKYQAKDTAAKHVKTVVDLINRDDVNVIVNACDIDDEGSLIFQEVIIYSKTTKPTQRIFISDNTTPAIQKALKNLKPNSDSIGQFKKGLARQAADQIFGMSMTRAYTIQAKAKGYQGVLSVGRVQTPVLGLIATRYRQNTDHKKSFYYTVNAEFKGKNGNFTGKMKPSEYAPVDDKTRIIDETYTKNLVAALGKLESAEVIAAGTDNKQTSAPLPFNLVRLQQYMNRTKKMTAQRTLDVTQELREKYKAITYNRSDCSYLSDEQFSEAPQTVEALKKIFNRDLDIDTSRKSSAFNSSKVTAHTAIIPTNQVPDLNALTAEQKAVYMAIAEHYMAQFMPKKAYQEASAQLKIGQEDFTARATKITAKGFTELFNDTDESEDDTPADASDFDALAALRTGQTIGINSVTMQQSETKAPPLFTEATLLAALVRAADFVSDPEIKKLLKAKDADKKDEHGGIGTPATRAAIIETLKKRNFITEQKGKLIPTEAGLTLIDSLPKKITEPDLTALWSEKQNEIEQGNLSVEDFINELYTETGSLVNDAQVGDLSQAISGGISEPCPSCGQTLRDTPRTLKCSNTECQFTLWKTQFQKELTTAQLEKLLKTGETPLIKGFKNKDGKPFDAVIQLDDKSTGKTKPVYPKAPEIKCPICDSRCRINDKGLFCSTQGCMMLWRVVASKKLTDAQLTALATKGKTSEIKGFTKKDGSSFDAIMTFDKNTKKTGFAFNNKK